MTETNGWPGKPGVPLNPEEPSYHWVKGCDGENTIVFWRGHGGDTHHANGDLKDLDHWSGYPMWIAQDWTYLGPCLTPDQETALQARVAELEARLERLMGPPPDKTKLRVGLIAAGISEKTADEILSSPTFNRAALEGEKP